MAVVLLVVGVSVVGAFGLTVDLFGEEGKRGDLGGGSLADEVGLDDIPPIQLVLLALNINPHERPLRHYIIIYKLPPLRAFKWRSDYFRYMKQQSSFSQFYESVLLIFQDKQYIFISGMLSKIFLLTMALISATCKVYQVVSLSRHGARYYLDKYYDWNSTYWGQLSAVGMRQHQKLGQILRRDYIDRHVLSDVYNQNQIEAYSTNANRTITSGEAQLYGMYPLGRGKKMPEVDKKYNIPPYQYKTDTAFPQFALPRGHQPIPVTINSSVLIGSCSRTSAQMQKNELRQLQTYKEMNLTYYPFMKKMADMFNFTTLNFSSLDLLYDALVVSEYLGRPKPTNLSDSDYGNLKHLETWYDIFRLNYDLAKAYNTNTTKRIIQNFDGRIKNLNSQKLKWTALFGHDNNINCYLNTLNISSAACQEDLYRKGKTTALNCQPGPDFAANLIFELQSDNDKDFYVKIRYNGKYVYLCEKKSFTCSYNEWKNRVQSIILPNSQQICNGKKYQESKGLDSSQIVQNQ